MERSRGVTHERGRKEGGWRLQTLFCLRCTAEDPSMSCLHSFPDLYGSRSFSIYTLDNSLANSDHADHVLRLLKPSRIDSHRCGHRAVLHAVDIVLSCPARLFSTCGAWRRPWHQP